jgi:hypothetical protein
MVVWWRVGSLKKEIFKRAPFLGGRRGCALRKVEWSNEWMNEESEMGRMGWQWLEC